MNIRMRLRFTGKEKRLCIILLTAMLRAVVDGNKCVCLYGKGFVCFFPKNIFFHVYRDSPTFPYKYFY